MIRTSISFFLIALAVSTAGCHSLLKPSERARRESFARSEQLFSGNREAALRQTFFVFAGDALMQPPKFDPESHRLVITAKPKSTISQGLAVAVSADGYLLTAGHVLGATNYVLGWFTNGLALKPVRVVCQQDSKKMADFALIKVDDTPAHVADIGAKPVAGDPVFAVGCYREDKTVGGRLGFTAGRVQKVDESPSFGVVEIVDTDVPLWEGDSGGALLSSAGQLIGITSGYVFDWYVVYWKYHRFAFRPDKQAIDDLIAHDR